MPTCLHRASWKTPQDVRWNMQKNVQNKKDVKQKVTQEEVEGVGAWKSFLKLFQVALMNPAGQKDAWHLLSNSADEHGLIHPWDLPTLFWPCVLSGFLLNCTNCYVFVSNNMFLVSWCFDLPFCLMFFLFFTVYKNIKMETLNIKSTFIHLYWGLFLVSCIALSGWF